ncbi:hypothetical protein [uncultured Pseudacidovorax sp.]|uniref:hypothetical protein n=1 Tax=uncultured Pseudacidovorax sp. TaxID=679313 RepID=UPI0025F78322|nr:hypothetical protein [uncultured Pseudacidovorax sp.]
MFHSAKQSGPLLAQLSPSESSGELRQRASRVLQQRRYFAKDRSAFLLEIEFVLVAEDIDYLNDAVLLGGETVDFLLRTNALLIVPRSDVMLAVGTAIRLIRQRDADNALVINWAVPFAGAKQVHPWVGAENAVEIVDLYPKIYRGM